MKKIGMIIMCSATLFFSHNPATAQMERSKVDEQYKWNLGDLYENETDWQSSKQDLSNKMDKVSEFKGQLASSAETLLNCLDFTSDFNKEWIRLFMYARMHSDLNTSDPKYQAMTQEVQQIGTRFSSIASFIEPEILKMDAETVDKFIAEKEALEVYEFYLQDLQRKKEHRLTTDEEKIIAEAGLLVTGPSDSYNIFSNAELPYPEVKLSTGDAVTLTPAGFAKHRASTIRADRELVFQEFFGALKGFNGTLGTLMSANLNTHLFNMRVRNYKSCLAAALDENNIPVDVYHSLVKNVNDNLESFHRYLNLKRRMLGVDQLKYSDLYAPTVKGVDFRVSPKISLQRQIKLGT